MAKYSVMFLAMNNATYNLRNDANVLRFLVLGEINDKLVNAIEEYTKSITQKII